MEMWAWEAVIYPKDAPMHGTFVWLQTVDPCIDYHLRVGPLRWTQVPQDAC